MFIPVGVAQQQRRHGGVGIDLTSDLVSWWSMDETSGNRADSHGSNTLTDNNTVQYAAGLQNNSALFSPANSEYLDVASGHGCEANNRSFSVSLWVKFTSITPYAALLHCGNGSLASNTDYLLCVGAGSYLRFYVPYGGTWYYPNSGAITTGTWYHVYSEYDYSTKTIGLSLNNGTLVTTSGNPSGTNNIGGSLYFARYYGYSYSDIELDEVAFYSKTLTTSQRSALFNAGSGLSYGDI